MAKQTPGFLGSFLVNCFVMVFALFYFLVDGEDLVAAAGKMIPLDQKYQRQLLLKFVEITRAVTSATLLTALSQAVLLGIGYHVAGFQTTLLLMMLTFFAAFVPVVGSAIVWVPASLWLLVDGHVPAAMLLAGYSFAVVMLVDNVMKPMILHGQANLHPLLAFLSVLGGVAALGPLGIFVGPMAVAFLQTGLQMLNVELDTIRNGTPAVAQVVAAGSNAGIIVGRQQGWKLCAPIRYDGGAGSVRTRHTRRGEYGECICVHFGGDRDGSPIWLETARFGRQ